MTRYNLHTHSVYSRHGEGEIMDYVNEAERIGLHILGFTEHCPYPDDGYSIDNGRMWFKTLPTYVSKVQEAKERKGDLSVFLGWECDWIKGREEWIHEVREKSDYLIFGLHYLEDKGGEVYTPFHSDRWDRKRALKLYGERYVSAVESGLFLFSAHPDLFMNMSDEFVEEEKALSRDIIAIAKEKDMVMEVNGSGIMKAKQRGLKESRYPRREFWEMAKDAGLCCIVSADAHDPGTMGERLELAQAFASSLDLSMVEPGVENGKLVLRRDREK